jgi:hypothetical protein
MSEPGAVSDLEFLEAFRTAIGNYLDAVDRWEAGYRKYYRLPGYAARNGSDLAAEEKEYNLRRREIEAFLPRARRLCLRHEMDNPFPGLMRITLGNFAPQHRIDSAIGRNERSRVTQCLLELTDACREWAKQPEDKPARERSKSSLLGRVVDYFF